MDHSPRIAVVILNWNGRHYLEKFLPGVMASAYENAEIVIADNGSTDDSVSFIEKNYPGVTLVRFPLNHGFAKGYNEVLKTIRAEYYLLLNSDVEVQPGWIQPMVGLLESDKSIAACQPKLLNYANRSFFEYAGGAGGWIDKFGYPFAKGRIFDIHEEDTGQYNDATPVFWASGAALFIRSAVFHEMKGFDEYFFAHQEEIDLCWRIQLAGHKIYSCPASVVYHVGGGTLPKTNSAKTFLNFRNNRIMLSKNLPFSKKIWLMPARDLFDAISAWKGLFSGNGGYFIAIIRARLAFTGWWLFHKKKSIVPVTKKGKLFGYWPGNIAWQHFIRKKKNFREIVGKSN